MTIGTPLGWAVERLDRAVHVVGSAGADEYWHRADAIPGTPVIRRIGSADILDALRRGSADFGACRTDVLFLCVFYPVVGLLLARLASSSNFIPLLFPLASGFALVGPLGAVGLNEMSRLREQGAEARWIDVFGVLRSPSIWSIILLGLALTALFVAWLGVANLIYRLTLGPNYPLSVAAFLQDVFYTGAGWTMIAVGVSVGLVFAIVALAVSVVSFSLLLDRKAGVATAILTSVRAVAANPGPMALWGVVVAAGLVVGSVPLLMGLVVVLPLLGHTTWHLYRKMVAWEDAMPTE